MTCEGKERELALYVESELPAAAAGVLKPHLRECPRCQAFLRSLAESQRLLKSLAAQPLDDAALVELRRRAFEGVSRDSVRLVPSQLWPWALAAAVVLLAVTLGIIRSSSWAPAPRTARDVTSVATTQPKQTAPKREATPEARLASNPASPVERQRATLPRLRAVSRDVGPRDALATPLNSAEADQLVRAIVALSRIERVPDEAAEAAASPTAADVVRLATADPEVVIYWQIDSNGG